VNVYAEYGSVDKLHIAPGLTLKHSPTGRYTDQVVQVVGDADGVHVRPVVTLGPR
jgi:hypothetical protein